MTEEGDEPEAALASISIEALDAGYSPFPSFREFAERASVDEGIWSSYLGRLASSKAGADSSTFDGAVAIAMRSAAVQTGAIEGLYQVDRGVTYSIATQAIAWQAVKDSHGADIRGHFEAQLAAYELVLDIATNSREVSQAGIRDLHVTACAGQETYVAQTPQGPQEQALVLGVYKTLPNHVMKADGSTHSYAPVLDTPPEMARLIDELRSESFQEAHPILQAAYAHYAFVCIHPFADGNGRVSRALASIYLFRGAGIPLVIFADQQVPYYNALEAADRGDFQPFAQFILQRALDAMELVIDQINLARTGGLRGRVDSFRQLLTSTGGLSHRDLDAIAERIDGALEEALRSQVAEAGLPTGVTIAVEHARNNSSPEIPGYRLVRASGHRLIVVQFLSDDPASARLDYNVDTVIAEDKDSESAFLIRHVGYERELHVRLGDIHPSETELFRLRINAFAEAVLNNGLDELISVAREALRSRGYPA